MEYHWEKTESKQTIDLQLKQMVLTTPAVLVRDPS